MSILDFLFGNNQQQPAPATAPAAPQTAPPQAALPPGTNAPSGSQPTLPANYADFYNRLMAATAASVRMKPAGDRGLYNWLTGRDVDNAATVAAAGVPGAWQQYQEAQAKLQSGQLGTAQAYGAAGGMTGVPIDPNNPMAAVPALEKAYGGILNPAPTTAPSAPGQDPLQTQRALYQRLGRAMQMMGNSQGAQDYFKLANQGVPDNSAVLNDGRVVPSQVSTPAGSMSAQDYNAIGAGKTATADTAPRVAGQLKVAGAQAAMDRETNWQKIAAENQFKGPQLLRAPDGSVVGVTPGQMAANATNGALNGYRPLSDEDTKALGAFGEQYAKDQATLPEIRQTQTTIGNMLDQAKSFAPGTFGDVRHAAGRLLTGLGVNPDDVAKTVGNPAGADVIVKNTLTLAMDRLKQSFGGGREAGFVVQMAQRANPNVETQPEAYSFMLNTMNQAAQRQADYVTQQHAYRQTHGSIDGFAEQFDKTHPATQYANQAVADTYGVPAGSRYLGRHQGAPVFAGSNGKKFMVAH